MNYVTKRFFSLIPKPVEMKPGTVLRKFETLNKENYEEFLGHLKVHSSNRRLVFIKEIYNKSLKCAETLEDFTHLTERVLPDFVIHHYLLSCTQIDDLVEKAIQKGAQKAVNSLFSAHRALHYYPHPQLVHELLASVQDFTEFKELAQTVNNQHFIVKTQKTYDLIFERAETEEDHDLRQNTFFNIIDYSAVKVEENTVEKVMSTVNTVPEAQYYLSQYKANKLSLSSSARESLDKVINPEIAEEAPEEQKEEPEEEN